MKLNSNKKSVKVSLNLFALYAVLVCGIVFALPAFAASDPLVVVENLSKIGRASCRERVCKQV